MPTAIQLLGISVRFEGGWFGQRLPGGASGRRTTAVRRSSADGEAEPYGVAVEELDARPTAAKSLAVCGSLRS